MTMFDDVREFHRKFNQPAPDRFTPLSPKQAQFRIDRIREECDELVHELTVDNPGLVVHECIDVIYVALGTVVEMGVDPAPFWEVIHRANMAKVPNPDPDGKPLKPEGWAKPNCEVILDHVKRGLR